MSRTVLDDLMRSPLLEGTDLRALRELDLRPRARTLAPGQLLFDRDDASLDVHFVLDGRLLAVLRDAEGRELLFSQIAPGGHLGELSAIDGQQRSLSVYAQTEARVITIAQEEFRRLIEACPTVRDAVMRHLVTMIRKLTIRSYETAAMTVEDRLRAYLVRLATEHGALTGSATIHDAPSHSEIASVIGSNREAVSRAVSMLKRSGIIEAGRRRFRILAPDVLMAGLVP